jgi:hypothetical protein
MDELAEVAEREQALRRAMLAGDVEALDELIDDSLVFTGPDGRLLSKADDLAAHRRGTFRFRTLNLLDAQFHRVGGMVLTTTRADVAGILGENEVGGSFAYTRLWKRSPTVWRIVAGHCALISPRHRY